MISPMTNFSSSNAAASACSWSTCNLSKKNHIFVALALLGLTGSALAATREVGSGQTYSTISAALSAAAVGDVVNIHAGIYNETCTVGDNNVTLRANPGESPVIVGRVEVSGFSGVTVSGLAITGWSSSSVGNYGIHADGGSGLTVSNCNIYDGWGSGIYVRNSTNCILSGNTMRANKNAPAADGTGIVIISGHASAGSFATGIQLLNNTIFDHQTDGIQIHGQYITVAGNNVYNNITTNWAATHPDGIQFIASSADGMTDCQHVKLYNNIFRNHTQNIFVEGSQAGNASITTDIQIWNNVVYCDSAVINGVAMDSIATKGLMIKYVKDCVVYNNDIGRHGNAGVYFQSCGSNGVIFKNNIVNNTLQYGVYNDTPSSAAAGAFNYNQYNCAGPSVVWGAAFYATRLLFIKAVTNQDANSRDGDPLIASWSKPTLAVNSPCIDAGTDVGSPFSADDLGTPRPQGGAWDIGAFEFVGTSVVAPSGATVSINVP